MSWAITYVKKSELMSATWVSVSSLAFRSSRWRCTLNLWELQHHQSPFAYLSLQRLLSPLKWSFLGIQYTALNRFINALLFVHKNTFFKVYCWRLEKIHSLEIIQSKVKKGLIIYYYYQSYQIKSEMVATMFW